MTNLHVAVAQNKDDIVFLRELRKGACGKSYGIQCAKLAGMPKSVIRRAGQILKDLEQKGNGVEQIDQLTIFDVQQEVVTEIPSHLLDLEQELLNVDPNELSPFEALKFVFELRSSLKKQKE